MVWYQKFEYAIAHWFQKVDGVFLSDSEVNWHISGS